jgi:hypothetical protein
MKWIKLNFSRPKPWRIGVDYTTQGFIQMGIQISRMPSPTTDGLLAKRMMM